MRRILQSLSDGVTEVVETPCPQIKSGHLLIETTRSLISPGTEKMLVDFGRASLIDKIRQQPDKVRLVLDKVKTDGLLPTLDAVKNKLDHALSLGYCNVGKVLEVGEHVEGFAVGDRVISNGSHAEVVCVPKNLCCKIPDDVSDDTATFTVLGAIALQGLRLANPTLGECFVVSGLGLIGLLTVQLLRAQGCRVLGIDFDSNKLKLAEQFGAQTVNLSLGEDPISIAHVFSRGRGVDGVLITASTKSSEPVHQAAQMSRKKGRIVLVGVTGLALSRADFYEKELTFQVSCSYGPGRYDTTYEEQGNDYPIGFVRWTEQRNFEAVLDLLQNKKIIVDDLITQRFAFLDAKQAYQFLSENKHILGLLLEYTDAQQPSKENLRLDTIQLNTTRSAFSDHLRLGFIGAGNYASRILIPAFKKTPVTLKAIACNSGINGPQIGKKFGFELATTALDVIFSDQQINAVVIATRHNDHADLICRAIAAEKHVFVEKPLCMTFQELDKITKLLPLYPSVGLMVGFNRRFSPYTQKIIKLLEGVKEPKSFIMTVNAGSIPLTHWTQNAAIGGGRIIGEVCHFIDLLRYLAAAPITQYHVTKMQGTDINEDKVSITLSFADGSFGVIHYLANGHRSFPKERLEIFSAGKILQLDNFRKMRGYGWPTFKSMRSWQQDKGQTNCVQQFVNAIKQGLPMPIPLTELLEVSKVTLEIANAS